jgi:phage/plasmid-like protein (TIGR03299 family)
MPRTDLRENIMTDTMVSSRLVPWMKLGELGPDVMTSEEAIQLGGLDFTVSKHKASFEGSDGSTVNVPGRFAMVRDDDGMFFEYVSGTYGIVQYRDAFKFMDEVGDAQFVAAGQLKGGRQGFMVVKMPQVNLDSLAEFDPHDFFAVLRTSHDKTRAVEVALMPLRGMCMNQLTLHTFAMNAPQRFAVPHAANVEKRMEVIKEVLVTAKAYVIEYAEQAHKLAEINVSTHQAEEILKKVVRKTPKQDETILKITDMWKTDETVGFPHTGWGLVNAVSSYYDWERQGGTAQSRFLGAIEGQTRQAIERTANRVLTLR